MGRALVLEMALSPPLLLVSEAKLASRHLPKEGLAVLEGVLEQ